LKVTFLGTGTSQGVPVIACECDVCRSVDTRDKRLRTSAHIEVDGQSIVIDTGPDFRQQMLSNDIKKLDAVIFTHEHRDHVAGLDDVRSFNFKQKKPMPIYGNENVLEFVKKEFHYAFAEKKYPGVPQIDLHRIENRPFSVNSTEIVPVYTLHHKLPVFGFRIKNFSYITDANYISKAEKEKLKNSEVLVLNALQHDPHISHFTLEQALDLSSELKPGRTYLTHISHKLGKHEEISKLLPENVYLAHDGLSLKI
jgi:phosphoribosyl 1,2-cyclic phosphate phosphodiesterase